MYTLKYKRVSEMKTYAETNLSHGNDFAPFLLDFNITDRLNWRMYERIIWRVSILCYLQSPGK